MVAQLSGKIYPDKTFSIGVVPSRKKRLDDDLYDKDIEEAYDSYSETYSQYGRTKRRNVQFLANQPAKDRFIKGHESSRESKKYGKTGITRYGKKSLSCFGAILQDRFDRSCLGFGTATVPNYSDEILLIVGSEWGQITRRFFQKLKRHCEKQGKQFVYFGCTEIQEKRYRTYGIPVPHLHFGYVCRSSKNSAWYFTSSTVRRFWQESLIESISRVGAYPEDEDVCYRASIDLQIVKKSISAYMAKYVSKGVKIVGEIVERGFGKNLPSQWWFASMQMKKWLKESIIRMHQAMCASFFYGIESNVFGEQVTWWKYVEAEVAPGEYRIFGMVGRLHPDFYNTIKSLNLTSEVLHGCNVS